MFDLPPLAGAVNFRDIGGLPAEGGTTRHRTIFRSGRLSRLTVEDREYLDTLGIRLICDFRSSLEQSVEPYRWLPVGAQVADWGTSASGDVTMLSDKLDTNSTALTGRVVMLDMYRELAERHADRYSTAFKRIAAGNVPAILACAAGKDRTGVAVALLLALIGTPREAIVENYAISDKVYDFSANFFVDAARAEQEGDEQNRVRALLRKVPSDALGSILASDPDYIVAALDSVAARYGSIRAYARVRLGMADDELVQLHRKLVK